MAKSEWGTKRTCQSCGAAFYDLKKKTISCPKCNAPYNPEPQVKGRRAAPVAQAAAPKPAVAKVAAPAPKEVDLELDDEDEEEEDAPAPAAKHAAKKGEDEKELIEDASDLGEDEDDIGEVKEHIDDGVGDKA